MFKGIDRSFELRGESSLIWSVKANWGAARQFFLFHFKGTPSQDQQKTFRRRLITFKVTLTGQSHFMPIFLLRKVTLRGHINSLKWPHHPRPPWTKGGGTPSPAVEGPIRTTGEKPGTLSTLCYVQKKHKIHQPNEFYCTLYTVQCTVYSVQSHQLRKVTLRSHTNSVVWMYAVCGLRKVTFIQLNHRIFWTNCVNSFYRVGVIA